MTLEFDVAVLGAGPGGYVAAIRAAQLGLKVAIVEKSALGGVCLNIGCVPSKALLKNAEVAHTLQHRGKEFGFQFENLKLDYSVAFKRSRQVSGRLVKTDGETTDIHFNNIIIATGARPRSIPGVDIDGEKIITYKEAILSDNPPEKVVIIGGGPIGVEFAYIWNNYGVEVTVVEMLPRLMPNEDPEISEVLEKAYKRQGIKFVTGVKVEALESNDAGVRVALEGGEALEVDQVLIAIGFKPNVENIGLEKVGVKLNDSGAVDVDEVMRTNVPHVYAIGDVVAPEGIMLAHVGSAMGIVAAETIAGHPTRPLEYRMLPRCTYCVPQIASFGYTEEQAVEAGYEINVGRFPFQPNGKALGMGERDGFIKIVADAKYGEILGAHMVGPDVTELLPELTLAHSAELTAEEVARNVHAHPTLSEVLMEAAHGVEGQPIHM